jgi:hypothetical protein
MVLGVQNADIKSARANLPEWKTIPSTIGFRLDEEHKQVLFERAQSLKMSVHDLARHYVVQMLHETDERQRLIEAVVSLREEIIEARKDIAVSAQELLVSAGNASPAQSRSWVKANLLPAKC